MGNLEGKFSKNLLIKMQQWCYYHDTQTILQFA
jgi:hypothetical protein